MRSPLHRLSSAPLWRLCLLLCLLAGAAQAQGQAQHPADQWEFAVETGYLKKVKHNSPFDYRIVPTQLVWRSPPMFEIWRGASGARFTVRNRLALVAETIVRGPEDYYVAFAGSPSFELWSADRKTALFYEIGGGAGLLNSKHVAGGQGQDFAFNWFTQLGLRRQLDRKFAITGGAYFTHHSNLGMTHPNPGIDVLGVNIGVVWSID
jgi:lipid A 3-O-deacylase